MVGKHPNNIAINTYHYDGTYTAYDYAKLNNKINRWAYHLEALGVKENDVIACAAVTTEATVIILLALMKLGATYAPLPIFQNSLKASDVMRHQAQIDFYLSHLKPTFVLSPESQMQFFTATTVYCIDSSTMEFNVNNVTQTANPPLKIAKWAYILATTGSTGEPKFVRIPSDGLITRIEAHQRCMDLVPADRIIQFYPFTFDASLMEITMTLATGATLYPAPSKRLGYGLVEFCSKYQITAGIFFPKVISWLGKTQIKKIVCMGDAADLDDITQFLKIHTDTRIFMGYGVTEATIAATLEEINRNCTQLSIGKPIDGIILRVYARPKESPVADETKLLCETTAEGHSAEPTTEIGELYLADSAGGVGEYLDADLNKNRFSIIDGHKFYRTGDCVSVLKDSIVFNNRYSRSYKSAEVRWIHPEYIEKKFNLLLGEHFATDNISHAVVLERNLKSNRLDGAILLEPTSTFNESDLYFILQKLRDSISSDMAFSIPMYWHIAKVSEFDADARAQIAKKLQSGELKCFLSPASPYTLSVESDEERVLKTIWQNILGIPELQSSHYKFFEQLNASSLQYLLLEDSIEIHYKITLDPEEFKRHQTIAYLARYIRRHLDTNINTNTLIPITEIATIEPYAPNNQLPLFLIHGGDGDISAYKNYRKNVNFKHRMIFALKSPGISNIENLGDSVEEMADHYSFLIMKKLNGKQQDCIIGGWSAGGIIGYEVKNRLHYKYNINATLLLIDSKSPMYWQNLSKFHYNDQLQGFIKHIASLRSSQADLNVFITKLMQDLEQAKTQSPIRQVMLAINIVWNSDCEIEIKNKLLTALCTAKAISIDYKSLLIAKSSNLEDTSIFVVSETENQFNKSAEFIEKNTILGWDILNRSTNVIRIGYSPQVKNAAGEPTHLNVVSNPEFLESFNDKLKFLDGLSTNSLFLKALLLPILEAGSLYFLQYENFDDDLDSVDQQIALLRKRLATLDSKQLKLTSTKYNVLYIALKNALSGFTSYRLTPNDQIKGLVSVREAIKGIQASVEVDGLSIFHVMALLSLHNINALLYRNLRRPDEAFIEFTHCINIINKRLQSPHKDLINQKCNINKIIGTVYSNLGHLVDEISTSIRIYSPPRIDGKTFIDNYMQDCRRIGIDPLIENNSFDKYKFFMDSGMQFHRLARFKRGKDMVTEHGFAYGLSSTVFYLRRKVMVLTQYLNEQSARLPMGNQEDLIEIKTDLENLIKQMQRAYINAKKSSEVLIECLRLKGISEQHKKPLRLLVHFARLYKHGGEYEASIGVYSTIISDQNCPQHIVNELTRERAEVYYLASKEVNKSHKQKEYLEKAEKDLMIYQKRQSDYRQEIMGVLSGSEGKFFYQEIVNNLKDAQVLADLIREELHILKNTLVSESKLVAKL